MEFAAVGGQIAREQKTPENAGKSADFQAHGRGRIRTISKTPGNSGVVETGGADSDALSPKIDAELARVIAAWPSLTADARRSILAIVEDRAEQG